MRILNVMLGRGLGGLEQALLDYDDALGRYGHEVHTVIHPEAALRPALEARGATWHALPHRGNWDPIAVMRLRRLVRRVWPAVCIAHGNRAMNLLRHAGVRPLAAVMPNYKIKCQDAAAAYCPSLDLKRYAETQGVPAHFAYHIPYMVEVPPLPPPRAVRRPPVVGAMGRFVAKKGFDVFIRALGLLKAQGVPFRATLGGDGPDRAALQRLASELGLGDLLTFPGWVLDKSAFFAGIDLFCLPSHHEPFGIVLIEAMSQALPIVATDSEGPTEILHGGTDGIVVPRGDVARLAEALGRLIADPVTAARLGTNAHQRALATYDIGPVGALLDSAVRETARRAQQPTAEALA